ncbi:putative phosphoenolpyruvate synthase, partial [Stegodyphus mimosarum]
MSAAGQMDTFLGVSGLNEILHAIKKCWASQFGYIAIQYKRRYGQRLNSPMAVVIQEMVACDVAGVLFTCDPLTGNPAVMTITANYGLGESVVSGSEEPDTIELQRDPEDHLHMKGIIIGAKSRKIIVKDGEGTALENVSENEKTKCCLSQELVTRLGYLGIEVERYYRSHRDIEWGVQNNNIYLFQSRPVTSGANETSFEIEHEFDNPLRVENDFYSVCNVGEVIPGALTPLGMEFFYKVLTLASYNEDTAWLPPVRCQYFYSGMMVAYNHGMFGVTDMFRGQESENLDYFSQASMISFFGRIIRDEELFEVCKEKYEDSTTPSSLFGLLRVLLLSDRKLRKEEKICEGYHIAFEKFKTSRDLFYHLLKKCSDLTSVSASHLITSQASSVWNMLIFSILGKAKGGFDDEVYNNASCLLSTGSDVESADVPSAIQSLAFHISKAVNIEEFRGMSTEDALSWLQETNSSAGIKFREFLMKHGHRCIKEFDLYSIPWGSHPKPLVKLLQ